jgi:DNA-binding LacI/PurR family transcriptional regulator
MFRDYNCRCPGPRIVSTFVFADSASEAMGVTMRELAKIAGVSLATVSLALRDHPRISPNVRERIKALAAEVGYRPNPVVSKLIAQVRASKTTTYQSTLGAILTGELRRCLEVHTFRDWLESCKTRAAELGYGFEIFSLADTSLSPERLTQVLDARRIQGLVVVGPFPNGVIPPELDSLWKRSAVVLLGERPVQPTLSCVLNNQFSTSILAFRELIRLGYERPALCINPELDDALENRFLGGYLIARHRIPRRRHIPPFHFRTDAETDFQAWMEKHRPDAIITLHYEIKDWLETAGMRVPGDVGLAHLDWTPKLAGWAGTDQNNTQLGYVAIDMLIGQLYRNEFAPPQFQKCMFINSTWRNGQSLRTPPGRG